MLNQIDEYCCDFCRAKHQVPTGHAPPLGWATARIEDSKIDPMFWNRALCPECIEKMRLTVPAIEPGMKGR